MHRESIPEHPVETTSKSFQDLGLSEAVLQSVREIGFEHPTPIQAAVIPPALEGRDLIGLAETGSGKTAAFVLPIADRLTHGSGLRGLILSPTREIALQTKAFLDLFGRNHKLKTVCLIGGVKIAPQMHALKRRADILVATPGRLYDHMQRGTVKLSQVSELVLDEADHMLDLGFLPQIDKILRSVPKNRHTMMFSATMPGPIEGLAAQFMRDPVRIDITPEGKAAHGISHRLYLVAPQDKKPCLLGLLHEELGSTLVFIRRKMDADWLFYLLQKEGHPVERLHSDLSQGQRVQALQGFREGEHRILVATDIAARGLDVPGIQHVINFDVPENVDDYIHRAGRTARGEALGTVSTIAAWMDLPMIRQIEATLGETLPRCSATGVQPYVEFKPRTIGGRRLVRRRR
jgi:ATP-dependent RNA helicase RhlE